MPHGVGYIAGYRATSPSPLAGPAKQGIIKTDKGPRTKNNVERPKNNSHSSQSPVRRSNSVSWFGARIVCVPESVSDHTFLFPFCLCSGDVLHLCADGVLRTWPTRIDDGSLTKAARRTCRRSAASKGRRIANLGRRMSCRPAANKGSKAQASQRCSQSRREWLSHAVVRPADGDRETRSVHRLRRICLSLFPLPCAVRSLRPPLRFSPRTLPHRCLAPCLLPAACPRAPMSIAKAAVASNCGVAGGRLHVMGSRQPLGCRLRGHHWCKCPIPTPFSYAGGGSPGGCVVTTPSPRLVRARACTVFPQLLSSCCWRECHVLWTARWRRLPCSVETIGRVDLASFPT